MFIHAHETSPKIVMIELSGRLGNNMFIIASALGIAALNNATICHNHDKKIPFVELMQNEIVPKCALFSKFSLYYATHREKGRNIFEIPKQLHKNHILRVKGYLQSFKYFQNIEIKQLFTIKKIYVNQANDMLTMSSAEVDLSIQKVGIHVRRTDHHGNSYIIDPPIEYFENAIHYFRQKYIHVHFFIVSDDVKWCQEQSLFSNSHNITILNTKNVMLDFTMLTQCHHIIMSVGTFSWWGAYLGAHARGGEVIYYKYEFNMKHDDYKNAHTIHEDYYPGTWIGMGVEYKNISKSVVIISVDNMILYGDTCSRLRKMGYTTTIQKSITPDMYDSKNSMLTQAMRCNVKDKLDFFVPLYPKEIALILSHSSVWESIVNDDNKKEDDWTIILEDDVLIHKWANDNMLIEKLTITSVDWIVYLGVCNPKCQKKSDILCGGLCSHAYAITKHMARNFSKLVYNCGKVCKNSKCQIDQVMYSGFLKGNFKSTLIGGYLKSPCHRNHFGIMYQDRCNQVVWYGTRLSS